jgi:PadR family transcriptional regulator PadR
MTMGSGPRRTLLSQLVLRPCSQGPRRCAGCKTAPGRGLSGGTVHPILTRLEQLGWLASVREDLDAHRGGPPRRRYSRLTKEGPENARIALVRATTPYQHLAQAAAPPLRRPGMSAERRTFVDAIEAAFGTAREPARILTPTPARELTSDDFLRREGVAGR